MSDQPRTYPPKHEVERLWAACARVTEDPQATELLSMYELIPAVVARAGLLRVLPSESSPAYPAWLPGWMRRRHPLVAAAIGPGGGPLSLCRWGIDGERWPKGHRAKGLVFCDNAARTIFAGEPPHEIVWTSGLVDLITAHHLIDGDEVSGVVGIFPGSQGIMPEFFWAGGPCHTLLFPTTEAGRREAANLLVRLSVSDPFVRVADLTSICGADRAGLNDVYRADGERLREWLAETSLSRMLQGKSDVWVKASEYKDSMWRVADVGAHLAHWRAEWAAAFEGDEDEGLEVMRRQVKSAAEAGAHSLLERQAMALISRFDERRATNYLREVTGYPDEKVAALVSGASRVVNRGRTSNQ